MFGQGFWNQTFDPVHNAATETFGHHPLAPGTRPRRWRKRCTENESHAQTRGERDHDRGSFAFADQLAHLIFATGPVIGRLIADTF